VKFFRLFLAFAFLCAATPAASPYWQSRAQVSAGFSASCTESSDFIARTSGLSNTDKQNYDNLICGLVTDTVWADLDVLYVFAAPDETTALLNLKSASFAATKTGSPTFTAYQGFTGLAAANNFVLIPTFLGYPQFTRNNAHVGVWENTSRAGSALTQVRQNGVNWLTTRTAGDQFDSRITENTGLLAANTESRGHFLGQRTASNAVASYINGVQVATGSTASTAIGGTTAQVPVSTSTSQISFFSLGLSLSGKEAAFYNRLRTYATAVGLP
jgi:hypothetical protein